MTALLAAALVGAAAMPAAQAEEASPASTTYVNTLNLGVVLPTFTFRGATLVGAGTGMLSRGRAAIQIDNVTSRVRTAYIYWSYARETPYADTESKLSIRRVYPNEAAEAVELTGERVGSWPACGISGRSVRAFRARVPTSVVIGNGIYLIAPDRSLQGDIDGNGGVPGQKRTPLWFGASLFVIGTGNDVVSIYDGASRDQSWSRLVATLRLPAVSEAYRSVKLHQFGTGGSRTDSPDPVNKVSAEITTVNGVRIAGPGSPANDSDWNGATAGPNLFGWDHSVHEVLRTTEGSEYNRSRLRILLDSNGNDCPRPFGAAVAITPERHP
ncbi:hypothetical protein [Methylobrevis albus]|uniref:Uncharacterized protein n=1 Tax=Methylobrevis albus TaxID=2793297 RepID=A0A931MZU4_9HYPH|nr:hypothetical protein [Methylobrevis albus]MBH0239380.1 hypothetical protein [Methylobrevis albus]